MITSIDTREYSINSWKIPALDSLDFQLPQELEAGEPPEARGLTRDQVRLLVSYRSDNRIINSQFNRLSEFLSSGDVLVINTSGTLNSALNVIRGDGTAMELHLSTELPAKLWIVELRQIDQEGHTSSYYNAKSGERFSLPGSGQVTLLTPYRPEHRLSIMDHQPSVRLWIANLDIPGTLKDYLDQHGFPIRYKYVRQGWPNSYYQTVYATEMGSAEMPSAGRAFTYELITQLVAKGVHVVPVILHTGVASLEDHEPPYEEFYRIPRETARTINAVRAIGKRIVAIGTTVVRALESVADDLGKVQAGEGWTRLVITPERGLRAVDALLTGFHEPRSSHLYMLAALTGLEHLQLTYSEALKEEYLWHEFGDLHLILP